MNPTNNNTNYKNTKDHNTTLTGSNAHTRTKAKKSDDFEILEKFGIDGELATDFVKHRKALKCPITDTAIKGFEREAGKAGISLREAITIAIERGWKGFKADWQWRDEQPLLQKIRNIRPLLPSQTPTLALQSEIMARQTCLIGLRTWYEP